LLGNIPIANSLRGDIVDSLEDTLVDVGYERKRSTGGRISYRAEGGSIKEPESKDVANKPTNEEMLQWDTVIGADTTTEGSGLEVYDAATEGKLASYLSGEAKDAYNFLKDYDYSDLDIMDTLQKGGTAMLTGIADSIKSGVDASTKAVAGQEYNPNVVLEPVVGAGAGSAMFSAPKGALRVFGGKSINPNLSIPKDVKIKTSIKGAKGKTVDNLFSGDNDVVGFHGTVGDTMATTKFDTDMLNKKDQFLGEGLYITIDPDIAVQYANMRSVNKDLTGISEALENIFKQKKLDDGTEFSRIISDNRVVTTNTLLEGKDIYGEPIQKGQNVLPLDLSKLKKTYLVTDERDRLWAIKNQDKLKEAGYDSIAFDNFNDRSKQIVVFPEHVDKVQKLSNEDIPLGGKKLTPKEEGFRKGGAIYNLQKRVGKK
jgi:hypothetical protein